MRYFDFTLTPDDGAIHPADRIVAEHPGLTRESVPRNSASASPSGAPGTTYSVAPSVSPSPPPARPVPCPSSVSARPGTVHGRSRPPRRRFRARRRCSPATRLSRGWSGHQSFGKIWCPKIKTSVREAIARHGLPEPGVVERCGTVSPTSRASGGAARKERVATEVRTHSAKGPS